jgi:hypothetical protein
VGPVVIVVVLPFAKLVIKKVDVVGNPVLVQQLPATSLKAARAKRTEMRTALEAGKDPAAERRAERANSANSFETLDERRKMVQAWADHPDALHLDSNVVPFRRHA